MKFLKKGLKTFDHLQRDVFINDDVSVVISP